MTGQLVVLAKSPSPGRVKTRLLPAYTAVEASDLALAALRDTLDAAASAAPARVVLALDGAPGTWLPAGVTVLPQRGRSLDERIEHALADALHGPDGRPGPVLLVGMDTPQVTALLLQDALDRLSRADVDAVLGRSEDGGFWALGLHDGQPGVVVGVAMSTERTGADQQARLQGAGLRVEVLASLRDVDTAEDAWAVAALAPGTRFARLVTALGDRRAAGAA